MALAETTDPNASEGTGKRSILVPILSVALCIAGAAIGFFSISTGLIPLGNAELTAAQNDEKHRALPDVSFVEIPTMIVTLPPGAKNEHLRFTGMIEVPKEHHDDVEFLMPRIQDVLNGYLRALTAQDIEGPGALFKIRLQMYRRIVVIVGLGKAKSLLVTEFILN